MSTPRFHPAVATWFGATFSGPTAAQALGWPAIAAGRDTLIAAPTGSGKTLAAFLACIDDLVRRSLNGGLEDRIHVLYISPLKALGNDIEKNLRGPLAGITAELERAGAQPPPIRVGVRSGDTPRSERARMTRRPPHILITTPESLYILLTARRSREALRQVSTVIVDEIHAVAGSKRGSHLALSIERLDALVTAPLEGDDKGDTPRKPPVRIGLSATQRPIQTIARLLVGTRRALPEVVDVGHQRELDLHIEVPTDELGAVASTEAMGEVYDRIADLVRAHRTTLVFVNTRRLVERTARALGERLGPEQVVAHHGSLATAKRLRAEQRLKHAEVAVCVATASLELGIDVGEVELVVQMGSPRSIATFLQRVGRSGHFLGGIPKGRLFALTRDQLVECGALIRAVRAGRLDRIIVPSAPLDILAQQTVAAAACEPWNTDALFELMVGAAPYAGLERADFDEILTMLSEGVATERGRSTAHLHHDRVNATVKGRRGARLAAITGGGAIPDRADYRVLKEPDELAVGTLDEDFAIESLPGDVFVLGNATWRVRRVESGTVRVEDASGQTPTIPFWFGEAPARTRELSDEVSALRGEVDRRLREGQSPESVASAMADACAMAPIAATQMVHYLDVSRRMLGAMPTAQTLVCERFFDEAGGMQLVIHSPLGGRLNRAWGLALRKRFCVSFNFELQAAATDDGLVISLGPHHSFPLEAVFDFLHPESVRDVLTQAILASPAFAARWRWNVTRSLTVLRFQRGKRVPPPILRMRTDDMLAAVFPSAAACQENIDGPIVPPDHPLVAETIRDCVEEWSDVEGLRALVEGIRSGAIRTVAVDSSEPSPICHELLNANPYAFLDDAPLEERRTRAVALRRGLPVSVGNSLGALDLDAIADVSADAWPHIRDADELHDALLSLCLLPMAEAAPHAELLAELVAAGRVLPAGLDAGAGATVWVPAERAAVVAAAADVRFETPPPRIAGIRTEWEAAEAVATIVRGWTQHTGPTTTPALAARLGLEPAAVDAGLHTLESEGQVLRGRFTPTLPPTGPIEWCDRRVLARIHRRTLGRLRREIEPVSPAEFMRFLLRWQHVGPGSRLAGAHGLAEVLEQLQGVEVAAVAWERDVLPARLDQYDPSWLDGLCLSGDLVWGRLCTREVSAAAAPTRAAPLAFAIRDDLGWLLAPFDAAAAESLSDDARRVLTHLQAQGACFGPRVATATHSTLSAVEDALWELVCAGLVTADGFSALRGLLAGGRREHRPPERPPMGSSRRRLAPRNAVGGGRWSLLRAGVDLLPDPEQVARQLLRRYGVVFRDLLGRETQVPPWRELVRVLRDMEARGELRGGRFVNGFVGQQFALPEAVETLRALRRRWARHDEGRGPELVRVAATDPLNLAGIISPGPRVAAVGDNAVVYRDGVCVASMESGKLVVRDGPAAPEVLNALRRSM